MPGFATAVEISKVPVLRTLVNCLQSLYIKRAGTTEEKLSMIESIKERQKLVETDPRISQLAIFAEGTQTNGTYLATFKKGAFAGNYTVQPVVIKYKWNDCSPTWEGIPWINHMFVMMSMCNFMTVEVHRLPPFKPNDYLFTTHADKGKEQWEIYAWATRQVIAKFGKLKLTEQSNSDKLSYKNFMRGNVDSLTYAGKTWTADDF